MSLYATDLGRAITHALRGVPSAQPAQVAGYWANRDFWLAEFRHVVNVAAGYEQRVEQMAVAYNRFVQAHGGPYNRDEFGEEYQTVRHTTAHSQRQRLVGEVRSSLKELAERAFNLHITDDEEYDEFLSKLRTIRLD